MAKKKKTTSRTVELTLRVKYETDDGTIPDEKECRELLEVLCSTRRTVDC
jgi:hypothetical protein